MECAGVFDETPVITAAKGRKMDIRVHTPGIGFQRIMRSGLYKHSKSHIKSMIPHVLMLSQASVLGLRYQNESTVGAI